MNPAASTQTNIWLSNQVGNEIRLAWFSLISANIPDGNALGTLRIVVTNSTPLTWDLVTPGNCEFGDEEAETIPTQFISGNLTVNSLPTVNLGISSPFICPNAGSATLSTISDPNYTYAWYFNGQILPNSTGHSITTNLAGTYKVLVTNSSGCMRWSSLQTLGHYPLPNPVITATGSTTTCNQPVSLSVNSTQGGVVEYRWYQNGTLLSSTPSNQWVATGSGSYSVKAIDIGTGCSAWSSAMAVAINPLPNPVITFNGSSTFCLGDSLLLNIPNLSGHLYQWNSGFSPIPGATSASLMVRQGGQYTVHVTNEFACQNLSSPVTITTLNCNALSGVLSYNNTANTVLRNSKVYLALQNGSLVDSSATNNSGQYSIAGYSNNLYQIRATSSINWGGVNATDALGTVRHYTNVVPITGLRLKAADVNGSNSVNNTDALLITRRYSNLVSSFNVGNWTSENISIQAVGTPLTQNLKAICYGDINGSYNPSLVRLAPKITVLSSGLVYTEKHVVRWPLYAADNQVLGAVSLAMGIPQGLELVAVQSYMPNGHMEFGQNADELRVGWFSQEGVQTSVGQHLFDLVLRISDEQRSGWTPQEWEMRGLSELADYWATPYEFGRLSMPSISRIRESLVTSKDLLAIPNPSSGDTKLQWTLSAPVEHAYVRVVDALGRVVMEENLGTLEEGSHTLDLPSAEWALGSYGAQLLYTSQDGRSNRLGTILKRIR
ncbi:MAG: dockerin type I domain-containing protein [Bacteroidota bacterium]